MHSESFSKNLGNKDFLNLQDYSLVFKRTILPHYFQWLSKTDSYRWFLDKKIDDSVELILYAALEYNRFPQLRQTEQGV